MLSRVGWLTRLITLSFFFSPRNSDWRVKVPERDKNPRRTLEKVRRLLDSQRKFVQINDPSLYGDQPIPAPGEYIQEFQDPGPDSGAKVGQSVWLAPQAPVASSKGDLLHRGSFSQNDGPVINVAVLPREEMTAAGLEAKRKRGRPKRNPVELNGGRSSSAADDIEKNAAFWLMKSNSWLPRALETSQVRCIFFVNIFFFFLHV